jgi:hypothetical protein
MTKWYSIDWDKVDTINDIKRIIKAVDIKIADDHKDFQNLKYFLDEEDRSTEIDFSKMTPVTIEGEVEGPKGIIS